MPTDRSNSLSAPPQFSISDERRADGSVRLTIAGELASPPSRSSATVWPP